MNRKFGAMYWIGLAIAAVGAMTIFQVSFWITFPIFFVGLWIQVKSTRRSGKERDSWQRYAISLAGALVIFGLASLFPDWSWPIHPLGIYLVFMLLSDAVIGLMGVTFPKSDTPI